MDELFKQIIELDKRKEYGKVEQLLEENLREDPENIDFLFRLAMLEYNSPFADYHMCYLLLEKIFLVCQKHIAIARIMINYINSGAISDMSKANEEGDVSESVFLCKRLLRWFYENKSPNIINDVTKQIINLSVQQMPERIKANLEAQLQADSKDIETLLLLTVIEFFDSSMNEKKNTSYLEKIIAISEETEGVAAIIYAYFENYWSEMDEYILNKLKNLKSNNNEVNSMLKYAMSWYYSDKNDFISEEQCLKESIDFYPGHVHNYEKLAILYRIQDKNAEANAFIQKAERNIVKIFSDKRRNYDSTDVNEFLNEFIKGIYRNHCG